MESIRYINAHLKIVFDFNDSNKYKKEYDVLGISDEDAVGEWLKLAKARGETSESDQVLLTLLVELHRKIDSLSAYVKGEKIEYMTLSKKADILAIGFEHFCFEEDVLEEGEEYYGRIEMPIFPKREVPLFFKALNSKEAKIILIHEKDEKDWNAHFVARERAMIRELKASKERR